jgi:hypothetical protein
MPRGSDRVRPPTTTLFRARGRRNAPLPGAGGKPADGQAGGAEAPVHRRVGARCRQAERALRVFKRTLDVINEVGGAEGAWTSSNRGGASCLFVCYPVP